MVVHARYCCSHRAQPTTAPRVHLQCARALLKQVIRHRLRPERNRGFKGVLTPGKASLFGGKKYQFKPPRTARWHPPSRRSRTEWDFAVASSGCGKPFREEAVELKWKRCCDVYGLSSRVTGRCCKDNR